MKRIIKDPTYNIYSSGGNVETRKNTLDKDDLQLMAKDQDVLNRDAENEITRQITEKYLKNKKPGESFSDFIKRTPVTELLKLELDSGGRVISISDFLKQKEKPKIKKIDLAQGDFEKTVADLTDSDKDLIKELLRKSGVMVGD